MSTYPFDDEIEDDDPTDELPILTDVLVDEAPPSAAPARAGESTDIEDTGQFEPLRREAPDGADGSVAPLQQELDEREMRLAKLEAALEAEREHGAELERRALGLGERVAELERQLDEARAGRAIALERSQASLDDEEGSRRLRDEIALLTQHIENRNAIWNERAATLAEQASRIRELEMELAQRIEHQRAAERQAETATANARADRARLEETLVALEPEKRARASADRAPGTSAARDRAARLRHELAQTVALQATRGDDPQTLRRLTELESAIVGLEAQLGVGDDGAGPTPAPAPPELICLTGESPSTFAIDRETVTIGRSASCDLQVRTHYVSREHARITTSEDGCFIEDLGSRNGVFVNAVKVERHRLEPGDLITVGDAQFCFRPGETPRRSVIEP